MKVVFSIFFILLGFFILYIANTQNKMEEKIDESTEAISNFEAVVMQDIRVVNGQEIYVPAYSNI